MSRPRLLATIAALALLGGVAAPAAANPPVNNDNGTGRNETVGTVEWSEPGADGPGGGRLDPDRVCRRDGSVIPCDIRNAQGTYSWNHGRGCYVINVRVTADHPAHTQRGGDGGAFYGCFTEAEARAGARESDEVWWSDVAWFTGGPAGRTWIERLVASMEFTGIDLGIVPEPGPDRAGVLGLPTWMWVSDPTPPTAGVVDAADTIGDVALTSRATWLGVTWDMGDGTQVTCDLGTPYRDEFGVAPSPDCGHRYTRPGTYPVTATSRWRVDWQLGFETGSRIVTRTSSDTIRIAEVQVLNR